MGKSCLLLLWTIHHLIFHNNSFSAELCQPTAAAGFYVPKPFITAPHRPMARIIARALVHFGPSL